MWNAPQASATRPSSTSGARQSTSRAISAPYCRRAPGRRRRRARRTGRGRPCRCRGSAPFSRIQATATEVSRPPEKAMPTRSPTGREVRTLLMCHFRWGPDHASGCAPPRGRGSAGRRASPPSGSRVDHQDGVVAGDGAEHGGRARPGRWPRRGTARRRAGSAARPGWPSASAVTSSSAQSRASRRRGRRHSPPARGVRSPPSAGHGVDESPAAGAHPDRVELDQVTRQRGLGDLDAGRGEQLGELGLGAHRVARRAARRSAGAGRSWSPGQGGLVRLTRPARAARRAAPSGRAGGSPPRPR